MTDSMVPRSGLVDRLLRGGDGDIFRAWIQRVVTEIMEAEVSQKGGAERYERSGERSTHRYGHRSRVLETRLGALDLRIPSCGKARTSRASSSRADAEKALGSVVQEAYISGISTRAVDDLVEVLIGG